MQWSVLPSVARYQWINIEARVINDLMDWYAQLAVHEIYKLFRRLTPRCYVISEQFSFRYFLYISTIYPRWYPKKRRSMNSSCDFASTQCLFYQQKALVAPASWQQVTNALASKQFVRPAEHCLVKLASVSLKLSPSECS